MPLDSYRRMFSIGLKMAEIILALVYIGVVSYQTTKTLYGVTFVCDHTKAVSFIVITSGFVIPTFLLLTNDLHRESAEHQRKAIYPILYNISAVLFIGVASLTILTYTDVLIYGSGLGSYRTGGIMGLLNSCIYAGSAVLAFMDYRAQ